MRIRRLSLLLAIVSSFSLFASGNNASALDCSNNIKNQNASIKFACEHTSTGARGAAWLSHTTGSGALSDTVKVGNVDQPVYIHGAIVNGGAAGAQLVRLLPFYCYGSGDNCTKATEVNWVNPAGGSRSFTRQSLGSWNGSSYLNSTFKHVKFMDGLSYNGNHKYSRKVNVYRCFNGYRGGSCYSDEQTVKVEFIENTATFQSRDHVIACGQGYHSGWNKKSATSKRKCPGVGTGQNQFSVSFYHEVRRNDNKKNPNWPVHPQYRFANKYNGSYKYTSSSYSAKSKRLKSGKKITSSTKTVTITIEPGKSQTVCAKTDLARTTKYFLDDTTYTHQSPGSVTKPSSRKCVKITNTAPAATAFSSSNTITADIRPVGSNSIIRTCSQNSSYNDQSDSDTECVVSGNVTVTATADTTIARGTPYDKQRSTKYRLYSKISSEDGSRDIATQCHYGGCGLSTATFLANGTLVASAFTTNPTLGRATTSAQVHSGESVQVCSITDLYRVRKKVNGTWQFLSYSSRNSSACLTVTSQAVPKANIHLGEAFMGESAAISASIEGLDSTTRRGFVKFILPANINFGSLNLTSYRPLEIPIGDYNTYVAAAQAEYRNLQRILDTNRLGDSGHWRLPEYSYYSSGHGIDDRYGSRARELLSIYRQALDRLISGVNNGWVISNNQVQDVYNKFYAAYTPIDPIYLSQYADQSNEFVQTRNNVKNILDAIKRMLSNGANARGAYSDLTREINSYRNRSATTCSLGGVLSRLEASINNRQAAPDAYYTNIINAFNNECSPVSASIRNRYADEQRRFNTIASQYQAQLQKVKAATDNFGSLLSGQSALRYAGIGATDVVEFPESTQSTVVPQYYNGSTSTLGAKLCVSAYYSTAPGSNVQQRFFSLSPPVCQTIKKRSSVAFLGGSLYASGDIDTAIALRSNDPEDAYANNQAITATDNPMDRGDEFDNDIQYGDDIDSDGGDAIDGDDGEVDCSDDDCGGDDSDDDDDEDYGDDEDDDDDTSRVDTTTPSIARLDADPLVVLTRQTKPNGGDRNSIVRFGSWSEYLAIAGRDITSSFSSGAALRGGTTKDNTVDNRNFLTISNIYSSPSSEDSSSNSNLGTSGIIPSTHFVTSLTSRFSSQAIPRNTIEGLNNLTSDVIFIKAVHDSDNITIKTNITPDKRVIIYAPNGSINIEGGVTTINAILLAPNGTINTCSNRDPANKVDYCYSRLTIKGAVVAKKLQLNRTGGSGAGPEASEPAELFILDPTIYKWGYEQSVPSSSSSAINEVYSTELAPRL